MLFIHCLLLFPFSVCVCVCGRGWIVLCVAVIFFRKVASHVAVAPSLDVMRTVI